MKVVLYPHAVLCKPSAQVRKIGNADRQLIQQMTETMYASEGVGIAAPQVGVSKRIFIASPQGKRGGEKVFVNLRILKQEGEQTGMEGCLSLPGIGAEVTRAKSVVFEAMDEEGRRFEGRAENFLARIIQHELDHLEGKLIIDRVDLDQRQALLSEYEAP